MSRDSDELSVDVSVDGHELNERQQRVVDTYQRNIETFIRKDTDYGGSFENSAKIESIMKYGEVRDDEMSDIVARQIFVRGLMDKMNRFYQLTFVNDESMVDDERVADTLLDMGNYAIMLAALMEKYGNDTGTTAERS